MSENIKKLNNFLSEFLSDDRRKYFILAFAVLVFTCNYFFYLQPIIVNKQLIYKQITALVRQLKEQKKNLKTYNFFQKKIMTLEKQVFGDYDLKSKNVEYGIKLWIIGHRLSQFLNLSNLKIVSSIDKAFFTELYLEASVNVSNEKEIREFLYRITSLKSYFAIKKLKYDFLHANNIAAKSKNKIYFLFSILGKKNFFSVKPPNMNSDAIFPVKKINMCRNYLTEYPIEQLSMVGFLAKDAIDKKWGLIRLPNEHICKVEIGSEVGIEKISVVFIDAKKIFFQSKNKKKNIELIIKN